ncbi:MAG: type II toxin-antitoxin system VapB family antitoxin [Candidatus Aminicenantes bacterium]|nr:type II toxin-antitoxin system VapB family antitoxin [Candidatus Aminicenantes bacterium]
MNLPDGLLEDLTKATGERNKTLLIRTALEERLKKAKRDRLLELRGKLDLDVDLSALRDKDLL